MNPLRLFLLPLSLIFAVITWFRNWLYDKKMLKTYQPEIPVISVGNLSVGGTGKTPHCEFLIQLLSKHGFHVAYLSRGYGRKTRGFRWVHKDSPAIEIGDEAAQVAYKFPEIKVAVCENRVIGIKTIIEKHPEIDAIVLDDAYQYRKILPSINILLTDMARLYSKDFLLPFGRLRESSSGAKRADIIIVTKTPPVLPILLKKYILETLSPKPYQQTFFSFYEYSELMPIAESQASCRIPSINHVVLISGIDNPFPLRDHLAQKGLNVHLKAFGDHHYFTTYEIAQIIEEYNAIPGKKKIILTTEKDLARMDEDLIQTLCQYPFYKISIRVRFHEDQESKLEKLIMSKINRFSSQELVIA